MKNEKRIGMFLFVLGLIILIAYAIFQGLQQIEICDPVIVIGSALLIVGFFALLISIIVEQNKDAKKMKKEIKKEDLEP